MTETFELNRDDRFAVDIAMGVAQRLLRCPAVTTRQAATMKKAIHALNRLPETTPGVAIEYGILYTAGTEDFRETRYIDFRISESTFGIREGGSVYDKAIGSDRMPGREWSIEVGGCRETDCDLYDIEDSVAEYLNLGAEITVTDELEGDDDSETTPARSDGVIIKSAAENLADALEKAAAGLYAIFSRADGSGNVGIQTTGPDPWPGAQKGRCNA